MRQDQQTVRWNEFVAQVRNSLALSPEQVVDRETRLVEDLLLDSLTMYEVVLLLEDWAGTSLNEDLLRSVSTVGDVFDRLCEFAG